MNGSQAVRIFIPRETTARALGAEEVLTAIASQAATQAQDIEIIRTGSRGACWLEPMIEVGVGGQRIAYGPVTDSDVPGLFESGFLTGGDHPLKLGPADDIPFLKNQERLTFSRCGVIDPLSIADYRNAGGFEGLDKALTLAPLDIIDEVLTSGLKGRGGAAFPTGIKWQTTYHSEADQKYIVCNADEGDSGTFSDRMLMEGDPFSLIEGMIIAGLAVGARTGYIYLRSEYPLTRTVVEAALEQAREAGYLGDDIQGSGKHFDIVLRTGAGAYICGEETSLLESLEGKRGEIRYKPPLPAVSGLFGKPTVVNNVITLASVPLILSRGGEYYASLGNEDSRGTMPFQLGGNIKRGGLVEKAFGLTLRELIEDFGGGTATGRPVRAVQVGGPLGAYFPASLLDTPLDYDAFADAGGMIGHGGVVVFDDSVNMAKQASFAMEFCAIESCGKCTPCRIGSVRGREVIDRIITSDNQESREKEFVVLNDLCETMLSASLCAMGGLTPIPVMSVLKHFREDLEHS